MFGGRVAFQKTTYIIEGPLALHAQRVKAAREGAVGRDVLTASQLVTRLAGGLKSLAGAEDIFPAIQEALTLGGFQDLDEVRELPGTLRSVAASLRRIWRADINLETLASRHSRLADLALIERRVKERLSPGRLLPQALRTAALGRLPFGPALFGEIVIVGDIDIDRVWRPVFKGLAQATKLVWKTTVGGIDPSWFEGERVETGASAVLPVIAESCADPRSEVVEALRWVRARLSGGSVEAGEVALAAASTEAWDEHVLVLSRTAGLRVHFSHGRPALALPDGQACAALAEILLKGIDQTRVRRLMRRLPDTAFTRSLPERWWAGLASGAGLFTVEHWRQALGESASSSSTVVDAMMPIIDLLARGPAAAEEAGEKLFAGLSRQLWRQALRLAPADAVAMSLQGLRVPDDTDPNNSVVWCPASHLASSPRQSVRLLGMTSGAWPRLETEDPILPDHVLARRMLELVSVTARDRHLYEVIRSNATTELVLSRGRRNANGSVQLASPLWPAKGERLLAKTRVPEHACSEADRLLARPKEAIKVEQVRASRACWHYWHSNGITAHDGVQKPSSALMRALTRLHSTTSLRSLLRDPLGFVWRYALGWRSPILERQSLTLSPMDYGELVHDLIRRAVVDLETGRGFARATGQELDRAIATASGAIEKDWPITRAVPPPLLWRATVGKAVGDTRRALEIDNAMPADTRSWTEIPFGEEQAEAASGFPWNVRQPGRVGDTGLVYGGRIDRLDVTAVGTTARITDYKTGAHPDGRGIVLAGGNELQRVLYAEAVRQLLPDATRVEARLLYVRDEVRAYELSGDVLDGALAKLTRFIAASLAMMEGGIAVPGIEARDRHYDFRLALPADPTAYLDRKWAVFGRANSGISDLWREP